MTMNHLCCLLLTMGMAGARVMAQPPYPTGSAGESIYELQMAKQQLVRAERLLNDWAQLERYAQENAELKPPSAHESRVVFIGDSITDLWDDYGYGGFFPGKGYINRGISGQTTPQMLIRFRQDVVNLVPRAVVILAGTNDLAGNTGPMTLEMTESNLASMVDLAKANRIAVVLAALLPVSDYENGKDGKPIIQSTKRPPEKIKALNVWIRNYARSNDCVFLDYYAAMIDSMGMLKNEFSDDGLHANAAGYAVMAPLAEKAVQEALRVKKR